MSFIGDAALSALFQELFRKIASLELPNFATEAQVREEIRGWTDKLQTLRAVLDDAEDKQIQSSTSISVKLWLGKLKHLAYDVEDILDEFASDCLRHKLGGGHQATASSSKLIGEHPATASTSKIGKLIPACCTSFTPRAVMFNSDVMGITARLEGILEEMKQFNLVKNVRVTSSKVSSLHRGMLLHDESTVYGRDDDKEKLLKLLFRYETGDAKIGVIPIVGMGGLGKTTLAKLVYDDDSIPDHFEVKAWVCVSDVFDIKRVTKGVLESITSQRPDLEELSEAQLQLKTQLAGKKFVLVLDDVWTHNYDNWHDLYGPLTYGAPGSKIIVTTRDADVAKMVGTEDYYELKKMLEDDCWLLFKKHAFGNSSVAQSELEEIGRQIVCKRCDGLPLAARSLGGLLRGKARPDEWEEVLNSKMWSVLDNRSNILSVLELSYYYLPSHLKRCFAYCAILPKDFEFEQEDIILLWMAEGLISQAKGKREMEDLGGDYFRDLLSRSIFQASSADQSRFVMHDLVNDLAQEVAGDVCLRLDEENNVGEEFQTERVRHSSYMPLSGGDCAKRFAAFRNMQCLRTFLPLSNDKWFYLGRCVPNELVKNHKCLRVLSFRGYQIEELPNSIGDLKHLRYLDFSDAKIKVLPESTSSLCNLQTLILRWCDNLKKLPVRMDNLINLRHLDMTGVKLIEGIPIQIKELSNLKTLTNIEIDNKFFPLSNLSSLKSLRGKLSLWNLNTVVDASDAVKAKLKDKEGVRVLELWWTNVLPGAEVEDGGADFEVPDGLQPHQNIEVLMVYYYGGSRFPSWMGDPTFNNIVEVVLRDCQKCTLLPPLGMLPNLKKLYIERMRSLQRINTDFYGNDCSNSFPCLEVLHFEEMQDWEEWNAFEFEFRVLRDVCIKHCENLVAVLPSLPMLSWLAIRSCKEVDFRSIVDFNSLTEIELFEISSIKNLSSEGFVQRLKKLKQLSVSDSETIGWGNTVRGCEIGKCPQIMGMVLENEQLQMELASGQLESLELRGCVMLVNLPSWFQKAKFLRKLTIGNYKNIKSLLDEEDESKTPCLISRHCLEELMVDNCDSLMSLERRQLPPTLKILIIKDCKNLKGLLDEGETSSSSSINLEHLEIWSCKSLTSISSGRKLPATLKHLWISDCSKIESIAEGFDTNSSLETIVIDGCSSLKSLPEGLHNLIKLCGFQLYDCPCIVSFPRGGLPTTCLSKIRISSLEKLEAFPDNLHAISSLQELTIRYCPNLISFPSKGLPSNLASLEISSKHLFECGLDRLNSLGQLRINGEIGERRKVLLDKTGTMLPPSLTHLTIADFPNLKYISFRKNCLPESLQYLRIYGCPKLASFPKNGLPDSLLELQVLHCPILEKQCKEGKRPEWSKILHIPIVEIYS